MYLITLRLLLHFFFFFFNDTATTEIYTLSLHDALPIWPRPSHLRRIAAIRFVRTSGEYERKVSCNTTDRKSTRLNSSHLVISYAVFCLKKKKKKDAHYFTGSQMVCI